MLGLGYTDGLAHPTPEPVVGNHLFADIEVGEEHSCGLTTNDIAYCWGSNYRGMLGNGGTASTARPEAVAGLLPFSSIAAGFHHTCGITLAGEAYCWGSNADGQLGLGSPDNNAHSTPEQVAGGLTFSSIAAGTNHTCGITTSDVAYCWGDNFYGQLGDGSRSDRGTPTPVSGNHTFTEVSAGAEYSCALDAGGNAFCWGRNSRGQVGDGSTVDRDVPTAVLGGNVYTLISSGGRSLDYLQTHSCAIASGGPAYCWGSNKLGQLGIGASDDQAHTAPVPVTGGLTFDRLSAGGGHTCAITPQSTVYCWGAGGSGQLGNGDIQDKAWPVPVSEPK